MSSKEITRENIVDVAINTYDNILSTPRCLLLELPTGFGKTKVAISLLNHINETVCKNEYKIIDVLLLVAKRVHKQVWKDEIKKWGGIGMNINLTIECYESLKHYEGKTFTAILSDELQHVGSELRLDLLDTLNITEGIIGLSATMPFNIKQWFKMHYATKIISCSLQDAFDSDTLPEPKICLIPLALDTNDVQYRSVRNGGKGYPIIKCDVVGQIPKYSKQPVEVQLLCTERTYYNVTSSTIDYYKQKFMNTRAAWAKNKWMRLCNDRLRWLSDIKVPFVKWLLENKLADKRTITFCNSIEQTEKLGQNCIHSKNKDSQQVLDKFNGGEINHITSCNILNESVNLVNCQVGVYANLNASEIITRQRFGRILRHEKPMVIIPYYAGTREEELVQKMIQEYDSKLIYRIDTNKFISNT